MDNELSQVEYHKARAEAYKYIANRFGDFVMRTYLENCDNGITEFDIDTMTAIIDDLLVENGKKPPQKITVINWNDILGDNSKN